MYFVRKLRWVVTWNIHSWFTNLSIVLSFLIMVILIDFSEYIFLLGSLFRNAVLFVNYSVFALDVRHYCSAISILSPAGRFHRLAFLEKLSRWDINHTSCLIIKSTSSKSTSHIHGGHLFTTSSALLTLLLEANLTLPLQLPRSTH